MKNFVYEEDEKGTKTIIDIETIYQSIIFFFNASACLSATKAQELVKDGKFWQKRILLYHAENDRRKNR